MVHISRSTDRWTPKFNMRKKTQSSNFVELIASSFGFCFLLFFAASSRRRRQPNPQPTIAICDN